MINLMISLKKSSVFIKSRVFSVPASWYLKQAGTFSVSRKYLFCKEKATACKMQAVASYISRRFFVGNCRKFVVSLSYCQRKTFIFKALRRFLSTCRPYYRWRSCLLNWPVCKTVLIWALSGLCPDSALWLWAIIERIRIACQKAYFLADGIFGRSKSNMCFKMP